MPQQPTNHQSAPNWKSLATQYGVKVETLKTMLGEEAIQKIEEMKGSPNQRNFSPKMVQFVYTELGNPEGYKN